MTKTAKAILAINNALAAGKTALDAARLAEGASGLSIYHEAAGTIHGDKYGRQSERRSHFFSIWAKGFRRKLAEHYA